MTRPEQPQPYPGDVLGALPGTVRWRKEYRDALGRPLAGTVTLTGKTRADHGELTVLPAPVPQSLVDGVLEVDLPPDTYLFTAQLRTAEGARVTDEGAFTLA